MSIAKEIVDKFLENGKLSIGNKITMFDVCDFYKGSVKEFLTTPEYPGEGFMWIFPDDSCIYTMEIFMKENNCHKIVVAYKDQKESNLSHILEDRIIFRK